MESPSGLKGGLDYAEGSNSAQDLLESAGIANEGLAFGSAAAFPGLAIEGPHEFSAQDGIIHDIGFEFPKPPWPDLHGSGITDDGLLPSSLEVPFMPDHEVLIDVAQDMKISYPLGLSQGMEPFEPITKAGFTAALMELETGLAKQGNEKELSLHHSNWKHFEAEAYHLEGSRCLSKNGFPAAIKEERGFAKAAVEKELSLGLSISMTDLQDFETETLYVRESEPHSESVFPAAAEEEISFANQLAEKESDLGLGLSHWKDDIQGFEIESHNVMECECASEAAFPEAINEGTYLAKKESSCKEDVEGSQTEIHNVSEGECISGAVLPAKLQERALAKQVMEDETGLGFSNRKEDREGFKAVSPAAIEEQIILVKQVTENLNWKDYTEGPKFETHDEGESKGGNQDVPILQVPDSSDCCNCSETVFSDGDIIHDWKMNRGLGTGHNGIDFSEVDATGMSFGLLLEESAMVQDAETTAKCWAGNTDRSSEQFTRESLFAQDSRKSDLECQMQGPNPIETPEEVFLSNDTLRERKSMVTETSSAEIETNNNSVGDSTISKMTSVVNTEGTGVKVGDLVWAKVKSHPWWPGQIFDSVHASSAAKKIQKPGRLLVAFFGDRTFGWLQESQMVPFQPNFTEKVKQTSMRSFCEAVLEALDEVCRQAELGWFHPSYEGETYSAYSLPEENTGIQTGVRLQIHTDTSLSSEKFNPVLLLEYARSVACSPLLGWNCTVQDAESRGQLYAFRKGTFGMSKPAYQENAHQDEAGANLVQLQVDPLIEESDDLLEKSCTKSLPRDVYTIAGNILGKSRKSNFDALAFCSENDSVAKKLIDDCSMEPLPIVDFGVQIKEKLEMEHFLVENEAKRHDRAVSNKQNTLSRKHKGTKRAKEHVSDTKVIAVGFSQHKESEAGNNSTDAGETLLALAGYNIKLLELKNIRKNKGNEVAEISSVTMEDLQNGKVNTFTESDDTEETLLALAGYKPNLKEVKTINQDKKHTKADAFAMDCSQQQQLQSGSDNGGETLLALGGCKSKVLKKHKNSSAAEGDASHDVKKQNEFSSCMQSETQQENMMVSRKRQSIDSVDRCNLYLSELKIQRKTDRTCDVKSITYAMEEQIEPVNASVLNELDKASIEANHIPVEMNVTDGDRDFLPNEPTIASTVEGFVSPMEPRNLHPESPKKGEGNVEENREKPLKETLLQSQYNNGEPISKRKRVEKMNKDVIAVSGSKVQRKTDTAIVTQLIVPTMDQQSELVEAVTSVSGGEVDIKHNHVKSQEEETILENQENNGEPRRKKNNIKEMTEDFNIVSGYNIKCKTDAQSIKRAVEQLDEFVEVCIRKEELDIAVREMEQQHQEKLLEEEALLERQENNGTPARYRKGLKEMNKDVSVEGWVKIEGKADISTIIAQVTKPVVEQQIELVEAVNANNTQVPDVVLVSQDSVSNEINKAPIASLELYAMNIQNADIVVGDKDIKVRHQTPEEEHSPASRSDSHEETVILVRKSVERIDKIAMNNSEKIESQIEVRPSNSVTNINVMEQQSMCASQLLSLNELNKFSELNALYCDNIDKEKGDVTEHQKLLEKEPCPALENNKQRQIKRARKEKSLDLIDSSAFDIQSKSNVVPLKSSRILHEFEQRHNFTNDTNCSIQKKETVGTITISKEPNLMVEDNATVPDKEAPCRHSLQNSRSIEKALKTSRKGQVKKVGNSTRTSMSQCLDQTLKNKTFTDSNSLLTGSDTKSSVREPIKGLNHKSHVKKKSMFMKLLDKLFTVAKDPLNSEVAVVSSELSDAFLKFRDIVFLKSMGYTAPPPNAHQNLVDNANVTDARTCTDTTEADVKNISFPSGHVDVVPVDEHEGLQSLTPKEQKRKLEVQTDLLTKRHEKGGKLISPISISSRLQTIKDESSIGKHCVNNESRQFERQIPPVFHTRSPREVERHHFEKVTSETFSKKPKELPESYFSSVAPTAIFMRFPKSFALPSEAQLKATFARFGSLNVAATRVYRGSGTAQVVFNHSYDAEATFKYAKENDIFGQPHVLFSLRHFPHQKMSMQNVSNSGKETYITSVTGKTSFPVPLKEESRVVRKELLHVQPVNNKDNFKVKPPEATPSALSQTSQRSATVGHPHTVLTSSMSESAVRDSSGDMKDQMIKLLRQVSFIVGSSSSVVDKT